MIYSEDEDFLSSISSTKGSHSIRTYLSGQKNSKDLDDEIQFSGIKVSEDEFIDAEVSIHPRHLKLMVQLMVCLKELGAWLALKAAKSLTCSHNYLFFWGQNVDEAVENAIKALIQEVFQGSHSIRAYMSRQKKSKDLDEDNQFHGIKVSEDEFIDAEVSIHPRHLKLMVQLYPYLTSPETSGSIILCYDFKYRLASLQQKSSAVGSYFSKSWIVTVLRRITRRGVLPSSFRKFIL